MGSNSSKGSDKAKAPEPADESATDTTGEAVKRNRFGVPVKNAQPWSFGGRQGGQPYEGGRPQKDAERRAGKSRKVH